MAFVSNTACVRKESQKQKVCFSFPLPPFWLHWQKWVASGLKQWQQEEKSTGNSSWWKLWCCRTRATDSVYHHVFMLSTFIPSSLVTSFLRVSALADSRHQMCRIRHWTFQGSWSHVVWWECCCFLLCQLFTVFGKAKWEQFSPTQWSKMLWFLATVKWHQS